MLISLLKTFELQNGIVASAFSKGIRRVDIEFFPITKHCNTTRAVILCSRYYQSAKTQWLADHNPAVPTGAKDKKGEV